MMNLLLWFVVGGVSVMTIVFYLDDLETIGNPPTSAPRQFSFNLEGPGILSRDSLDQMVIQLTDESAHIINLPFLRPPDRRDFQ